MSYDDRAAGTMDERLIEATQTRARKFVVQELTTNSWLYYRMMNIGNTVEIRSPIEQPLYISPPVSGQWFTKGGKLPDMPTRGVESLSRWSNRYAVVPSGSDILEQLEQEGDASFIFRQPEMRAMEQAWAMRRLLTSGLVNGTGGAQPDGLMYMFAKLAPAAQTATIGGISKATNTWWRHQFVQLASNFGYIAANTVIPAGFLALQALKDACTQGTRIPSDLVTRQATFRLAKRAMWEMSMQMNMIGERRAAEYGYESMLFDGSYLSCDSQIPADTVLALHLEDKFDPTQLGNPANKTKVDSDLESIGYANILEMNGSVGMARNPNIVMRAIAPRSGTRTLTELNWIIHAMNLVCHRQNENGVSGSDNGSRWETWS